MKTLFTLPFVHRVVLSLALCSAGLLGSQAWAQPANRPLLTNQSGAKPNLMVALDNSGSMAFTYHETYNVTNDTEYQRRYCPSPYSRSSSGTLSTFNAGIGQEANYSAGPPATYTCYQRISSSNVQARTAVSLPYSPDQSVWNWSAQRSADVNPVYYNPKVRYLPRVDGSGAVVSPRDPRLPASDPAYNVVWVSNQNSASFHYAVMQRNASPNDFRVYHSGYASDGATRNFQGYVNAAPNLTGFTNRYDLSGANYPQRIPQHIAYTTATTTSPAFTYAYCSAVVTDVATGRETGCSARTAVNVRYGVTDTYTIPTPNTRTDCAANVCTNAQEVANILNWYRFYSTRQLATGTAIGLALADTDANGAPNNPSKLDNELRIGYLPINQQYDGPLTLPPGAGAPVTLSRGVRLLSRGSTENTQLFNWFNGMLPQGGTPLHYAVDKAASYYRMQNGVTENPWRTNPTDNSSPEMSCRRSFNLLFSDGGWTSGGVWGPSAAGPDYDNMDVPLANAFTRTRADGTTESFRYLRNGINTVAGRLQYVPFPSTGTGGLADLTAQYYWRMDMRPLLDNNIQTRPGQPTFWQNMTTYTVGYLIQPSGEATGTGLTFNQIEQYKTNYTLYGPGAPTVFPPFPTGNLVTAADTPARAQARVDDFIHAGYTGGARSFSARSADDVKSIFNTILAEILSASGRDAGVSVNTGGGDNSTLAGRLKYTVSYRTMDNSGDIQARQLAADGSETGVTVWSANQLMPGHAARRVFTMHDLNQPVDFMGAFSGLPTDVRDALATGPDAGRIPTNDRFINYLRGDNTALDAQGHLFRQRTSRVAAMVNPPAVFMGDARDFGYDQDGSGGVDGRSSYVDFTNRKRGYPKSLYVATNAGTMHAFSAAAGTELAAVMPRRSLRRMLNFAAEPYNFEYVLDGPITENDIFDRRKADSDGLTASTEWRAWRHLGIGTGGRGERLVYAVNSPIKPGATPNRIPDRADFLWETGPDVIDGADGSDVTTGYMSNSVRSGQTEDLSDATNAQRGRWIAAVNNGHYNGEPNGEKAGLVVLDAVSGEVIRTIPLPSGYSAGDGLSGVTLLRSYGSNTRVVAAYAGDANGQLWKFNLSGDPSTWHVEHGRPLFTVPGNRPIYGSPAWQAHEQGGFIVVFATGIMLEEDHLQDLGGQAIYGIWDRQTLAGSMLNGEPFNPVTLTQLEERTIDPSSQAAGAAFLYYAIRGDATPQIDWDTQRGWFIRMQNVYQTDAGLQPGERSIADVQNFGRSVIITTTVLRPPASGEMCSVADLPGNYVYIVNAQSASPELSRSFDVDGDGRLDAYAVAYAPQGGFTRGISVSRFRSRADGTALPDEPQTNSGDPSDPQVTETVNDRMQKAADEAAGESALTSKCQTMRGIILGTGEKQLDGGVFCPTTGWSRTQFQLSAPPEN